MSQIDFGLEITGVALRVNDLDKVAAFYERTIGLSLLEKSDQVARLGVGAKPLLELQRDANATRQPNAPGLFHTAFLLPERSDLGSWLANASSQNVDIDGAADHLVSEAVYLTDPEGNGIEIYADRPSDQWSWDGDQIHLSSRRFQARDLMALAKPWRGMTSGTTIGHVHLQVGSIGVADEVFVGGLGLDVVKKTHGMGFYSAGRYHHHFGANTARSRGVRRPVGRATGLVSVDIAMASGAELPQQIHTGWGTQFTIRKREALAA